MIEILISLLFLFLVSIIVTLSGYLVYRNSKYYGQYSNNEPRLSGLENKGVTCYMNSMIQALASSDELIKKYDELNAVIEHPKMKMLVDLLKSINEPENDAECNTEKLIKLTHEVQWEKNSQEDTFQMLSFFINDIEKNIKPPGEDKFIMPPKCQMLHTFSENASFNKIQNHLAIAVPLCGQFRDKPGASIESLLDAFFQPSLIDDGPNSTSMFLYDKVPDVLIFHIQANEWSNDLGKYIKPKYYITYKEILKYKFTIHHEIIGSSSEKKKVNYRLMAVVQHMGDVEGGHYITYRKYHKEWYLTNDEQVEKVSFKRDVTPYVMVYDKITK